MSTRVIQNVIKQEVVECTTPELEPSPRSIQNLRHYLKNPYTRDLGNSQLTSIRIYSPSNSIIYTNNPPLQLI